MNGIERFLLDETENDKSFNSTYRPIKIHKEKFDDRFTIIYTKDESKDLSQNGYSVSGYLDIIDKNIYETGYDLRSIIDEESIIKMKSFNDLHNEFKSNVREYIKQYSFDNKEALKDLAFEKYEDKSDWRITNYQKGIRQLFIREENPTIKLDSFYNERDLEYLDNYGKKNLFIEYLNNKEETVKKYANLIIESNKEELGLALHLYDDKIKYLERIKKNINNEFKDVYINKNIFESIRDEPAKTLNITIKYNNKELTFKCEYSLFKRYLMDDDRAMSFYGVAYDKVNNFLIENKLNSEKYHNDFEFSHISLITYGKKELYMNNNIKDKNPKERGDR